MIDAQTPAQPGLADRLQVGDGEQDGVVGPTGAARAVLDRRSPVVNE